VEVNNRWGRRKVGVDNGRGWRKVGVRHGRGRGAAGSEGQRTNAGHGTDDCLSRTEVGSRVHGLNRRKNLGERVRVKH
jgi:hypothetical protein